MEPLAWADQRKIASLAGELYFLDSLAEISERIVQRLDTLIGGSSVLVGLESGGNVAPCLLSTNIGPEIDEFAHLLATEHCRHPGVKYHRSHPSRPVATVSDLVPLYQWKRTMVFNEIYSKLEMQEQLAAGSPLSRSEYLVVIVNRARRTFTERDRLLLNILRLHLSRAWRAVQMRPASPVATIMEALEPTIGGSIVLLRRGGTIQFCSGVAQKHLEIFFDAEKPFGGGLPQTVEKWVRREITAFGSVELAVRPPQPLIVRRGKRSLHIRIAMTPDRSAYLLLLRAEDPASDFAKLGHLALGARATEVLYWLAKGKTNEEIGIILAMASETVKSHLKKIFRRLQVEN